jgi:hypothetical protein
MTLTFTCNQENLDHELDLCEGPGEAVELSSAGKVISMLLTIFGLPLLLLYLSLLGEKLGGS